MVPVLGSRSWRVLADDLDDEVGADPVAVKAPSREELAALRRGFVVAVAQVAAGRRT